MNKKEIIAARMYNGIWEYNQSHLLDYDKDTHKIELYPDRFVMTNLYSTASIEINYKDLSKYDLPLLLINRMEKEYVLLSAYTEMLESIQKHQDYKQKAA